MVLRAGYEFELLEYKRVKDLDYENFLYNSEKQWS